MSLKKFSISFIEKVFLSNSLLGQGMGMMVLQNSGNYADVEPTFYIRGLQSLSSSNPLILVDIG